MMMGPCVWLFYIILFLVAAEAWKHEHFYTLHGHDTGGGASEAEIMASVRGAGAGLGLSLDFYRASCPQAHHIVRHGVRRSMVINPSEAAGLLRILFHDCFVQGCDASILLTRPRSEQDAPPNKASLRPSSLTTLDLIKQDLEIACPGIVSCADVIALAAREAVFLAGGPLIPMPTGRRDIRTPAPNKLVMKSLPTPLHNFDALLNNFIQHGLDLQDLVALSGAHSIGEAHCKTLVSQLVPQVSLDMDTKFLNNISKVCLPGLSKGDLTIHLDFLSRDHFDNSFFKNVLAKRALFPSDLALLENLQSRSVVELFAHSQDSFFKQFSVSMIKLSQTQVLIGLEGEIRQKCSIPN